MSKADSKTTPTWGFAVPNPGSEEAVDRGCTCPILDNGHGRRSDGLFWYTAGCPVHRLGPETVKDV